MNLPGIGDTFHQRYRVDGELGRGGFGAVFAATDLQSGRPVALKVVYPDRGDVYEPGTRARFQREVSIVARLRDPHTVALLDHGASPQGLLYAVFERVPGIDLTEHLQRVGRMPPREVLHVLLQVLAALREAHAQGLLHRDIKPDNVRVFERNGDPLTIKLLDFGLARATDDGSPSVTKTGELLGTPRYMAPEQLLGRAVSPASDIYSLGMVAYELLAGAEALAGSRWGEQLDRLRTGHMLAVGQIDDAGTNLMAVIQRMTAREPQDRYPSAAAVLAALDASGSAAPPPVARPPSQSIDAGPPPAVLPRKLAIVAGGAVLLIVTLLVVWAWLRDGNDPAVGKHAPRTPPLHEMRAVGLNAPPRPVEPAPLPTVPDAGALDAGIPGDRGCSKPRPFQGTRAVNEEFASWWMHIPTSYEEGKPHPLLIVAHDKNGEALKFLETTGFKHRADRDGVIVLAPEAPGDNGWSESLEDVDWSARMVESVANTVCVDRSRIWVAGHGKGGRLASALSCTDWTTAAATSAFALDVGDEYCPERPKPMLQLLPMDSRNLPPLGGRTCYLTREKRSFDEMEQLMATRNECTGKPRKRKQAHGTCFAWRCAAAYETCRIEGGQGWTGTDPGVAAACAGPATNFALADQIWDFFERVPPLEIKTPAP